MNTLLKWVVGVGVVLVVLGAAGGAFWGGSELTRTPTAHAAPSDADRVEVVSAAGDGTVEVPVSKDVGDAFRKLQHERDDARRQLAELKQAAGEYEKARTKLVELTGKD